jgi:hypothetical protein
VVHQLSSGCDSQRLGKHLVVAIVLGLFFAAAAKTAGDVSIALVRAAAKTAHNNPQKSPAPKPGCIFPRKLLGNYGVLYGTFLVPAPGAHKSSHSARGKVFRGAALVPGHDLDSECNPS